MEPERRLEVAKKIVSVAGDHGIPPEDVVIDPLAMPVGAEPRAVTLFLETLQAAARGARREHDVRRVEHVVRAARAARRSARAFLAIAASHGLTSAIMDARSRRGRRGGARVRLPARQGRVGRRTGSRRTAGSRQRRGVSLPEPVHRGGASGPGPARLPPVRRRDEGGARARRARRCSTARAGTGSRSTRPAAATAPARSARCACRPGEQAVSTRRPARVLAGRAARRLAARVPRARPRTTSSSRCRRCRRGRRPRSPASAAT